MKWAINGKINGKNSMNTLKLINTLLNNQWVTREVKEEISKYLQSKENVDKTNKIQWDAMKAILRGKFVVVNFYIRET